MPEIGQVAPPKTPPQQRSSDPKPYIQTDATTFQRHASSTSFSLEIFPVNSSFSNIYFDLSSQTLSHIHHQHVGHEEDLYLQLYGS
jgi:hypothetical protein